MLKSVFALVIPLLLTVTEAQFRPGGPNRFGPPGPGGPNRFGPPGPGGPNRFGPPGPGGPPQFGGGPGGPPRPGLPGPRPGPPAPRPPPPPVPRPPPLPRPQPQPQLDKLLLCTYTQIAQDKCLYTLQQAANASIDLKLQCIQKDSYAACLSAIQTSVAHLVVADEHEYNAARAANLATVLYAHENVSDYYVAVAPGNITLIELDQAIINVNESDARAFHAAVFFNLQRGHDICQSSGLNATGNVTIEIVNTAQYNATGDELLICANRSLAEWSDYGTCNVEASLERAVFAAKPLAANTAFRCLVESTFAKILKYLGPESVNWNFFADFQNTSDVIFKNDTIGFSQTPNIRNGVTEAVFNKLHCNFDEQAHNSSQLE
ncbi:collagen alpha-1(X) chain isoform X2 [Zeugodacus cucurbitae]|uniref:collagen alpha-1(X) chain isoform X2 n=1 Tax=Zeugodacus cucurbitae TaxID=28588 RepID=UPI0023D900B7|nr:collagen alpha-1(X) chain isoform X2 [Zeugodacus cucurbitae]